MNEEENIFEDLSVDEMAKEIAEIVHGENIVDSFKAIERVILDLIANNCVDLDAAHEVIDNIHISLTTIINTFDAMQVCVWNNEEKLN